MINNGHAIIYDDERKRKLRGPKSITDETCDHNHNESYLDKQNSMNNITCDHHYSFEDGTFEENKERKKFGGKIEKAGTRSRMYI